MPCLVIICQMKNTVYAIPLWADLVEESLEVAII